MLQAPGERSTPDKNNKSFPQTCHLTRLWEFKKKTFGKTLQNELMLHFSHWQGQTDASGEWATITHDK